MLRLAALCGLLLAYLDLQKWSEQKEVQKSRVLMLVDTSLSMRFADADPSFVPSGSSASSASGREKSATAGADDVDPPRGSARSSPNWPAVICSTICARRTTCRSGSSTSGWPGGVLPKTTATVAQVRGEQSPMSDDTQLHLLRYLFDGGLAILGLSLAGLIGRGSRGKWGGGCGRWVWRSGAGGLGAAAALSCASEWENFWRRPAGDFGRLDIALPPSKKNADAAAEQKIDWATALRAVGRETRLGDALRQLIGDERSQPLAGVIVLTDGGQNAGLDAASAADVAKEAKIPIYAVGLGSDRRPTSVRIASFAVPPRLYPGDKFSVSADIEAQGLGGQRTVVELSSRMAGKLSKEGPRSWHVNDQQVVMLPTDGHKERVKFEVPAITQTGRRTMQIRVKMPSGAMPTRRRSRPAGCRRQPKGGRRQIGPAGRQSRRRFCGGRRQLAIKPKRPTWKSSIARIACCWSPAGRPANINSCATNCAAIATRSSTCCCKPPAPAPRKTPIWFSIISRPARRRFRNTTRSWPSIPIGCNLEPDANDNLDRLNLLEWWVADESGGLVLIPGPVNTNDWVADRKMTKLPALYPVEFDRLAVKVSDNQFGGSEPGQIEFTARRTRRRVPLARLHGRDEQGSLEGFRRRVRLLSLQG